MLSGKPIPAQEEQPFEEDEKVYRDHTFNNLGSLTQFQEAKKEAIAEFEKEANVIEEGKKSPKRERK